MVVFGLFHCFSVATGGCPTTCWVVWYPVNWVHCNSWHVCKLIFKPYTVVIYFCFRAISLFFVALGSWTTTCWVVCYPVNWVYCHGCSSCKLISNHILFIASYFFVFRLFRCFCVCNRYLNNNMLSGVVPSELGSLQQLRWL